MMLFKRIYIFPVLVFLVIIFSGWLVLGPLVSGAFAHLDKANILEEKLSRVTTKISVLSSLDQGELERKIGIIRAAVPDQKDPVPGLVSIRAAAVNSGLILSSLRASPGGLNATASAKNLVENNVIAYSVTVQGSREQTIKLLELLGKTTPFLDVERVDISQKGALGDATLVVDSFYSPATVILGDIDQPISVLSPGEERLFERLKGLGSF